MERPPEPIPEISGRENRFSTIHEGPLHAALKAWYARPGDLVETPVEGFIIDILQDSRLVEIQTGNFSAIRPKLQALVEHHPVRLVYPVAQAKWIIRMAPDGLSELSRRKSPKTGRIESVFSELVRIPLLLAHPNFSLEVLLTQEHEIRSHDPGRAWRRKGWVIEERRLVKVVGRQLFETPTIAGFSEALKSLFDDGTFRREVAKALVELESMSDEEAERAVADKNNEPSRS